MEDDFDNWNDVKKRIHADDKLPSFKEREVWWCSIGKNIGHEVHGKNTLFSRPVLVVRKFNRRLFWGIPLSSIVKDETPHYYHFTFKAIRQRALLTQMRLFDASRMVNFMGKIPDKPYADIKRKISEHLN